MKTVGLWILIILAVVLFIVLVGPLIVPIPVLDGTLPVQELADPDSQFIDIAGLQVHAKMAGEGEPALVLLHGFGASTFSWREVMEPLADAGHLVVAFDRPAYGLTERPMREDWDDVNPYSADAQVDLTLGLMDHLGLEQAILVGNSAGGTVATRVALAHPERVEALILVDAAIYSSGRAQSWIMRTPQMRRIGPYLARSIAEDGVEKIRSAWCDPDKVTDEIIAGYKKPLMVENWDRALYESTLTRRPDDIVGRLSDLELPILVITGDSDTWVPAEQSIRLASELPAADLAVLPACGHVPQEECPTEFMAAVTTFLDSLP